MKNKINPAVLSQIINDVWDSVERSKIGSIYVIRDDGSIWRTSEGVAICNTVALTVFNTVLQNVIPKDFNYNLKEENS